MRILVVMVPCLVACGSVVASDADAPPSQADTMPVGDYCDGWIHCDTFDGDRSAAWRIEVEGAGATIAPSTVRSKSGSTSLRASREKNRGENDAAIYKLEVPRLAECEFDIFVEPTFGAMTPEVAVAFMKLRSGAYQYLSPATTTFIPAGVVSRWGANTTGGVSSEGISEVYPTQPTRGRWLHVAMRYGYSSESVASSTIALSAENAATESKVFTFPAGFAFDSHELDIGIYAGTSPDALDIFFDNVRCR